MENSCYHCTLIDVKIASLKMTKETFCHTALVNKLKCIETMLQI